MCDGRRFQADGAATEKELLESWRLNRGTIKLLEHRCHLALTPTQTDIHSVIDSPTALLHAYTCARES